MAPDKERQRSAAVRFVYCLRTLVAYAEPILIFPLFHMWSYYYYTIGSHAEVVGQNLPLGGYGVC